MLNTSILRRASCVSPILRRAPAAVVCPRGFCRARGMSHDDADQVVVCGGGIIGVGAAYYLTLQGVKPLLIERTAIACGASGKAGGFLAQDWTDELARVSYELHEQLRDTLQADVGYRPVQSLAVAATAKGSAKQRSAKVPDWLDGKVSGGQVLGTTQSTAQVHPEKLTKAMMAAAEERGAVVRPGCVQAVDVSDEPSPHVTGVTVDGEHVPATAVVLALGPWTNTLEGALGLPHIAGQLGHSLVLKPSRSEALPADCLFVSWRSKTGHSCWGILNGPATGKALAELITTGASQCVNLSPYNPARFIRPSKTVRQKTCVQNYERTHLADREPVDPDSHFPEQHTV